MPLISVDCLSVFFPLCCATIFCKGPQVPSAIGYQEVPHQVLETRGIRHAICIFTKILFCLFVLLSVCLFQILLMVSNPRSAYNLIDFTNDLKKVTFLLTLVMGSLDHSLSVFSSGRIVRYGACNSKTFQQRGAYLSCSCNSSLPLSVSTCSLPPSSSQPSITRSS